MHVSYVEDTPPNDFRSFHISDWLPWEEIHTLEVEDLLDTFLYFRALIEEFLLPENFDLVTHYSDQSARISDQKEAAFVTTAIPSTMRVNTYNKNIVQISLYLEGIGKFSQVCWYFFMNSIKQCKMFPDKDYIQIYLMSFTLVDTILDKCSLIMLCTVLMSVRVFTHSTSWIER